jgi:putative peptidoglycan lipid II flippase
MRLAIAIGGLLAVVVAIIVAFNLGQGTGSTDAEESPSTGASSAPAKPVTIAGVSDFDPLGDGSENGETASLAVDDDPSTAWRTSTYYDPLEQQKDGVGLLVDLGEPTEVSQVDVTFIGTPTSFEILAAKDGASAPTTDEGLTRVGKLDNASTQAEVTLDQPVTTQYLVLWLTELPPVGGDFRGQVADIVVR